MINLAYPRESQNYYVAWNGSLFGPFDSNGIHSEDWLGFRSKLEVIEESRGIFGENNVDHSKLSGDLIYHPLLGNAIAEPDDMHPRRMTFPVYDYRNKETTITCDWGIAPFNGCSYNMVPTLEQPSISTQHRAFYKESGNWCFIEVQHAGYQPYVINSCTTTIIKSIVPTSGNSVTIKYDRFFHDLGSLLLYTDVNWTKPQSFEKIKSITTPIGYWTRDRTAYGSRYRARNSQLLSPTDCKSRIDSIVATLFSGGFPVEDRDYGDLAYQACESVNPSTLNMLGFLRDLKEPVQACRKLLNLKKLKSTLSVGKTIKKLATLKGASNQYLTVKYGVLPTLSDLERIQDAFYRLKPYIDKLGLKVYTAGYSDELDDGYISYHLTQRIKLAIGEEDNEFEALLTRLDSFGSLPTLENLWDLVNYSFVIDWFIDVGGFLERIDTRMRLSRYNIAYVTMSRKTQAVGQVPFGTNYPFVGSIDWVQYHRWVSDQCPAPPLFSATPNSHGFSHWLEAGALLMQRT